MKEAAARVLADPGLITAEYHRLRSASESESDTGDLHHRLDSLDEQRCRLIKLYQMGEVDDTYLESESRLLRTQMNAIEAQIQRHHPVIPDLSLIDFQQACDRIRDWVRQAEGEDFELIARALQIQVRAETDRGELTGVIPEYAPNNGNADVCTMVINSPIPVESHSS